MYVLRFEAFHYSILVSWVRWSECTSFELLYVRCSFVCACCAFNTTHCLFYINLEYTFGSVCLVINVLAGDSILVSKVRIHRKMKHRNMVKKFNFFSSVFIYSSTCFMYFTSVAFLWCLKPWNMVVTKVYKLRRRSNFFRSFFKPGI